MSLVPMLYHLFDDEPAFSLIGLGYHPNQCFNPRNRHANYPSLQTLQSPFDNCRRSLQSQDACASGVNHIGKDGFQVNLDVQHFAPNEIKVKTVNGDVLIEGEHEEKKDEHGQIYRRFVRRYTLPKEFDTKDVVSSLSSDGVLTIKAPPAAKAIESNERVIQIQQTGPAHLSVNQNMPDTPKKKMDEE